MKTDQEVWDYFAGQALSFELSEGLSQADAAEYAAMAADVMMEERAKRIANKRNK